MEWRRGPVIGRGSTATVSLATLVPSGELIAVKSTELSKSMVLQREQYLLSNVNCAYVVKYMGFNVTKEDNDLATYNLCMEYVSGGTLYDEIQRRGGKLDERMIRFYTRQILQGLTYLHVKGLAHCDVKSQNVLVGKDGTKIADLGCAKFVEGVGGNAGFATSEFSGTPLFMAPEVARRQEQGFAADIWAVGCTVVEMATGGSPWPEMNDPVSALYRIGFSGEVPEIPGCLSVEGKDFLSKCLRRDPKERWTAKELLEHPFLGGAESHFVDVKEITIMSSPCTVLDPGIWDSLETLEKSENLTHRASSLNSPSKRIQRLMGSALPSVPSVPNWSCDDDWITVRSNGIEETKTFSHENDMIVASELSAAASLLLDLISEEELQVSMFDEDFLLESPAQSSSNTSISNVTIRRSLVLPCESFRDDFVLENLCFDADNKDSCFIKSQLIPQLYHVYTFLFISNIFSRFNFADKAQLAGIYSGFSVPVMTSNKVISKVNISLLG